MKYIIARNTIGVSILIPLPLNGIDSENKKQKLITMKSFKTL